MSPCDLTSRRFFVRLYLTVFLSFAGPLFAPSARAQVEPFRFEPKLEVPLLVAGALGWMVSEQLKPKLAPTTCRLCRVGPFDEAGQRGLRWAEEYGRAARTSDWLLFGVLPVLTLGGGVASALHYGTPMNALVDAMVMLEALVLTADLTQLVKYTAARARPYVVTQREEGRDFVAGPDDFLSFFSGHTSGTFALAVAAGMTSTLRGYRVAPVVWAVGVPLAAFTGYLRIAADRHYLADVFMGALVGSAVGALIPWLHAKGASRSAPVMTVNPAQVTLTWEH